MGPNTRMKCESSAKTCQPRSCNNGDRGSQASRLENSPAKNMKRDIEEMRVDNGSGVDLMPFDEYCVFVSSGKDVTDAGGMLQK